MADHRKAGEHGRLEFLKQNPVADHVLDVIRHHGEHGGDEKPAETGVFQSRKGDILIVL